jgi:hypothetical protein
MCHSFFRSLTPPEAERAQPDHVRITADGAPAIEGVVDYATPDFLAVRTNDGRYRLVHAGPAGLADDC